MMAEAENQPEIRPLFTPVARPLRPPTDSPLSPDQLQAVADAKRRAKKVLRTAGVARFNGWTLALFAGLTLLGSMCRDVGALVVGIGLAVVAYNELRGGRLLREFDPRAPRRLIYNQLGLAGVLVIYGLVCLLLTMRGSGQTLIGQAFGNSSARHGQRTASREDAADRAVNGAKSLLQRGRSEDDELMAELRQLGGPEATGMLGDVGELARSLTILVYITVAAIGLVAPALTAAYYASRGRLLRDFLDETPAWVVGVLRASA